MPRPSIAWRFDVESRSVTSTNVPTAAAKHELRRRGRCWTVPGVRVSDSDADREEAADRPPVVVDPGPVEPFVPPGGVDAAVITGDEHVELVAHSRDRADGRGSGEE